MALDLEGRQFGKLTAVRFAGIRNKRHFWECLCACGNTHMARKSHLLSGQVTSCGCRAREVSTKHGKHGTSIYIRWGRMKDRCLNPNSAIYKHYGGRGITVCPEWMSFETFYNDMGDVPFAGAEVDRINNELGYSKQNCRWTTRTINVSNTRANHKITVGTETRTITEWAEIKGFAKTTILRRIKRGMTPEQAVTTPSDRVATAAIYAEAVRMAEEVTHDAP